MVKEAGKMNYGGTSENWRFEVTMTNLEVLQKEAGSDKQFESSLDDGVCVNMSKKRRWTISNVGVPKVEKA